MFAGHAGRVYLCMPFMQQVPLLEKQIPSRKIREGIMSFNAGRSLDT
jgi:hypothetical protein